MAHIIHQWQSIVNNYRHGALLLGNGASMAVSRNFGYASLLEHVRQNHLFEEDVQTLFSRFETDDFELILRLVWQAARVNKALAIQDRRTRQAYLNVRNCLIQAVRDIHPAYEEVSKHLPHMHSFLKQFNTVLSLNYDLLVYWAMMHDFDMQRSHIFKDCFKSGSFAENWRVYRDRISEQTNTLVFYPHGNLALCRDITEQEYKISGGGNALLNEILDLWASETYVPLFVSEGTLQQKIRSIQSSFYLSTVYREVLKTPRIKLTIFGWAMGEQDLHILQNLRGTSINRIAVSVFGKDQAYCNRIYETIQQYLGAVIVEFFDCESPGSWIHPGTPVNTHRFSQGSQRF
ncbi:MULTISPECIES: DUF4917 family protein [unclassified Pseudomonas]|uniref:DUF4917 family protein n=1 Tax=unclassified Pseudomonas TaxID=196821 RepID=UPI000C1610C2|nr:DUF4917 family protein [Pseudomonas sp. 2995-3]NMX60012.1 DUF4917 family protein [Pseudomonas sp. WS 5146]PIB65578.1 hypothetical protein AOA62_11230 [Pseudomonas sp. 2995-3]